MIDTLEAIELGGTIQWIRTPGGRDQPHPLDDPTGYPQPTTNPGQVMTTNMSASEQVTKFLTRSAGKMGYDIAGTGPLVVLVPGMGDMCAAPISFPGTDAQNQWLMGGPAPTSADTATAIQRLPLMEMWRRQRTSPETDQSARHLRASSSGTPWPPGPQCWWQPIDRIYTQALCSSVLFVRDGKVGAIQRILLRVAMARPWAPLSGRGRSYVPKLYAGRRSRRTSTSTRAG